MPPNALLLGLLLNPANDLTLGSPVNSVNALMLGLAVVAAPAPAATAVVLDFVR